MALMHPSHMLYQGTYIFLLRWFEDQLGFNSMGKPFRLFYLIDTPVIVDIGQ